MKGDSRSGDGEGLTAGGRYLSLGFGIFDQGLWSLITFATTILVARNTSTPEFGYFAVAISIFVVGLGLHKSAITNCYLVLPNSTIERYGAVSASAIVSAVGATACLLLAASLVYKQSSQYALYASIAAALPGTLRLDILRGVSYKHNRHATSLLRTGTWLTFGLLLGTFVAGKFHSPVPIILCVLGSGTILAVLVHLLSDNRSRVSIRRGYRWMVSNRGLIGSFAGDYALTAGTMHLFPVVGLVVLTTSEVGAFKGTQTLFGPTGVVFAGIMSVQLPRLAPAILKRKVDHTQFVLRAAKASLVAVLVAAAWSAALAMVPDDLGHEILGQTWEPASALTASFAWLVACNGLQLGAIVGIRATRRSSLLLRVRATMSLGVVTAGLTGGWLRGAQGAVVGMALVETIGVLIWWVTLRESVRAVSCAK